MYWPKAPIAKKAPRWMPVTGEIAPAERQDPSATERLAVLQHQLAEAVDVAQARADAKPAPLQPALGLEYPGTRWPPWRQVPDRLGTVVGQRPARGGRDQRAKQAAIAGRIVEDDALRLRARQGAQEIQDGAWPQARQGPAQAPVVGAPVVFLAPGHARAHPHGIADRDPLIGRAAQPRQVEVAAIVQAADRAIVERCADERRGDRLRGRVALPTPLRPAARTVALQRDLAVLEDQEPGRAAAGHVVAEAEADVAHLKGQVRERTGVRWERPHRVAAPDDARRPDLILVAEGRRLVLGCRVYDV